MTWGGKRGKCCNTMILHQDEIYYRLFIRTYGLCVKLAKQAYIMYELNLPCHLYSIGPAADETGTVSRMQIYKKTERFSWIA